MSTGEDHILHEQCPVYSLVPALDGSLELSEIQIKFLLHAIRDVNPEAVDAGARIKRRVLEVQRNWVVQFLHLQLAVGVADLGMASQSVVCYDDVHYSVLV